MVEVLTSVAESPLLRGYLFYSCILVIKMMLMSGLTARQRMKNKAFANPEDIMGKGKVQVHPDVERVRRAHLNDLENIPLFFVTALAYICTNPAVESTLWLFRIYTIARCTHTFVYAVVVIPQPARALSWFVGLFITGYMAISSILYFM